MEEYISREHLIKSIEHYAKYCGSCTDTDCTECLIEFVIKEQPTADVVEVVKCRDCKYAEEKEIVFFISDYYCSKLNVTNLDANDYCSYGERKE